MPWAVASTSSSPGLVIAHVDQLVVLAELDGDDAALERPAVGLQRRSSSPGRGAVAIIR